MATQYDLLKKAKLIQKNFTEEGDLLEISAEQREGLRAEITAWAATPAGIAAILSAMGQTGGGEDPGPPTTNTYADNYADNYTA